MIKRCIIYGRYSSDKQNEKSADNQVENCRSYATRQGWDVVDTFKDEAISGSSMVRRPGLSAALKLAEAAAVEIFLVDAIDRLTRDTGDLSRIRKSLKFRNIELYTVMDGVITVMNAGMRGIMSENYLDELSYKTKNGLMAAARQSR